MVRFGCGWLWLAIADAADGRKVHVAALGDEDDTVLSVPREGRRKMPILAGHVLMKEKNVDGEPPVDRR